MKILSPFLMCLFFAIVSILMFGCNSKKPDATPPPEKIQLQKLEANVWKIISATVDAKVRTDFTDVTLTFSGDFNSIDGKGPYGYVVGGTRPDPSPWPSAGKWKFGTDAVSEIIRLDSDISSSNPDLDVTYELTESQLTLSFVTDGGGYPGGRIHQVKGSWVFVLGKL